MKKVKQINNWVIKKKEVVKFLSALMIINVMLCFLQRVFSWRII